MAQTLAEIRAMLDEHGLSPRHRLGQNFLIDHNLLRKLVDSAGVGAGDLVLEVGPGTGTLTEELLGRGCRVVACEIDPGLAALVRERLPAPLPEGGVGGGFAGSARARRGDGERPGAGWKAAQPREEPTRSVGPPEAKDKGKEPARSVGPPEAKDKGEEPTRSVGPPGITIIEGDCLASKRELSPDVVAAIGGRAFSLVANLPYGVATPLLMTLLVDHPACGSMHVTIQREVADRLTAGPGSKDYGPISVLAALMAEVSVIATLPPECFWPRPEVTSAMVAIRRRAEAAVDDPRRLAEFCAAAFAQRRKQIGSVLGREFPWPAGFDATRRAEALTPGQILELSRVWR